MKHIANCEKKHEKKKKTQFQPRDYKEHKGVNVTPNFDC